ncbi:MAG: 50S ribosomal protein L23 [Anaerolineales bacterium]|jgi:large subunit ribosomal protein L23
MSSIYDVLRRPIITEKTSYQNTKLNQVVFEVAEHATKAMVKEAVETIFNVQVEKVNIMNMPAKQSRRGLSRRLLIRRKGYKKAIISLVPGESIEIFEGVR